MDYKVHLKKSFHNNNCYCGINSDKNVTFDIADVTCAKCFSVFNTKKMLLLIRIEATKRLK